MVAPVPMMVTRVKGVRAIEVPTMMAVAPVLHILDWSGAVDGRTQSRRGSESRRIGATGHQRGSAKCGNCDIDEQKFSHHVLLVMFPVGGFRRIPRLTASP